MEQMAAPASATQIVRQVPEPTFLGQHGPKIVVALVLTFVSGLVDIVGYLGIFHFFTAHLTGTTVQLGHGLITGDMMDVFVALSIVISFVLGSLVGRSIIEFGSRRQIQRVASITLAMEALLLIAAAATHINSIARPYGGLVLLAAAMGLQTATLTGIGPLTVHTTFVTGMVNKFAQLLARLAFQAFDSWRMKQQLAASGRSAAAPGANKKRERQETLFLAIIWVFYVAGAAVGTWSFSVSFMHTLWIGAGLLALCLAADQFRPLSIEEEREQPEH
jgi:uncharacterized membrane protein YoaK (UPF0700 family)